MQNCVFSGDLQPECSEHPQNQFLYCEYTISAKETAELSAVNAQLHDSIMQLKNLKANYVYIANELDHLRFQREQIEKDLDDVSRYRYITHHNFDPTFVQFRYLCFSMENNDHLMKIHKEILDQKSKMERAEREMKSSRKDATQNLNDKEFLHNFDVKHCLGFI